MGEVIFLERAGGVAAWCQENRTMPGARRLKAGRWAKLDKENIPTVLEHVMETLQARHWEHQTARFGVKRGV